MGVSSVAVIRLISRGITSYQDKLLSAGFNTWCHLVSLERKCLCLSFPPSAIASALALSFFPSLPLSRSLFASLFIVLDSFASLRVTSVYVYFHYSPPQFVCADIKAGLRQVGRRAFTKVTWWEKKCQGWQFTSASSICHATSWKLSWRGHISL